MRIDHPAAATPAATVKKYLAAMCLLAAANADAAYTVDVVQVGADVVATGSGTLNLAGLVMGPTGPAPAQVQPNVSVLVIGSTAVATAFDGMTGPVSLGPGGPTLATSSTGDKVAVAPNRLIVPSVYVSGAPLTSTSTWAGTTLAGLGLTNGIYTYTWAGDSLTIRVGPVTSFTGPSATGSGTITASFTGGGGACTFMATPEYIPVTGHPRSPPAGTAPAGITFPHGLFDFTTTGCTAGSAITMTITYPAALPAGTQYWKYGPTPTDPTPHWYVLPAAIAGATATFTITDGGLGDDDLAANGTIVDQGGPGVPGAPGAATAIPTLDEWALALMALLMLAAGFAALRPGRAS